VNVTRVLQSTGITLTRVFTVDETPTDAAGNVTVAVKRLDGTNAAGTFAGNATHAGTGTYTWALSPSPLLDCWTIDWTGTIAGNIVTIRDFIEIVGGFYVPDLAVARSRLSVKPAVTTADLAGARVQAEQEADRICQRAFVPRYSRRRLSGTGQPGLDCGHRFLRAVRSVTVAGVAYTSDQLAGLGFSSSGRIGQPTGLRWPIGDGNVVVEVEHGMDYVPENITWAATTRMQSILDRPKSGVPDRAQSFTTPDGGVYRLTTPDRQHTGIPDVDAVYESYYRPKRSVFA
jgi:hypothetical protein